MPNRLGVHVIGEGFGESIVLEMPGGGVGVIDCFCRKLAARSSAERLAVNPTLRFLRNELKADRLTFVALTHPHQDHGQGMTHLFQEYAGKIDEVWAFVGYHEQYLEKHFEDCIKTGRRLPIEELLDDPPGTFSAEFVEIKKWIDLLTKTQQYTSRFRWFAGYKRFALPGERLTFHVLGPDDSLSSTYVTELSNNVAALPESEPGGAKIDPGWEPGDVNHNAISASLLIEFGETRALLGGDMERAGWELVVAEQGDRRNPRPPLGCHLVKVSHHGSATGYVDGLYERFKVDGRKPVAVLTTYNRNRSPLPSAEGMDHLLANVSEVLATNRKFALRASRRRPAGIPQSWLSDIRGTPALAALLDETIREGKLPAALPPGGAPPRWVADIAGDPRLAQLLAAQYRPPATRARPEPPDIEHAHRVSICFDARGNEVGRYVGSSAGKIS